MGGDYINMFRLAIYCNSTLFLLMSIYFFGKTFYDKSDLNKLKRIVIIYFILNIINGCASEMTDMGFGIFVLIIFATISSVMYIVSLCCVRWRNKRRSNIDYIPMSNKKTILILIIPLIILAVPFLCEVYILNNCEYIIKYNYQSGFNSKDTYVAIINNNTVTVTLQANVLDRKGILVDELYYEISYSDGVEVSKRDSENNKIIDDNESIKKIALDAIKRCPSAKGAGLDYFSEGQYAIIVLTEKETHGKVVGEFFYHNNKYVKGINVYGDIEEIIYYK